MTDVLPQFDQKQFRETADATVQDIGHMAGESIEDSKNLTASDLGLSDRDEPIDGACVHFESSSHMQASTGLGG
jgi:hypothetical protein